MSPVRSNVVAGIGGAAMTPLDTGADLTVAAGAVALMTIEVFAFAALRRPEVAGARVHAYRYLIVYQWVVSACIIALWWFERRPWPDLLLGMPSAWRFAGGVALAFSYAALALAQVRAILRRPALIERVRPQIDEAAMILPRTAFERALWLPTAITAGICEEVIFRGFLLSMFASVAGVLVSAAITSVLFGFYHAYYGAKGIIKTGVMGLVFAAVALGSGSLIPAMIIHAVIDVTSGELGYAVLSRPPVSGGGASPTVPQDASIQT